VKIYLSGSALEIPRVKYNKQRLEAIPGITIVSTWIESVEKVGQSNPRDASREERAGYAQTDLDEAASANLIWLFAPTTPTRGAWVELGFGFARDVPFISSGDTKQSIFTALGEEFETDEAAFEFIKVKHELATRRFSDGA